jgi:hypothetical protein
MRFTSLQAAHGPTSQEETMITDLESRVSRKLMLRIIPFFMLLYLLVCLPLRLVLAADCFLSAIFYLKYRRI